MNNFCLRPLFWIYLGLHFRGVQLQGPYSLHLCDDVETDIKVTVNSILLSAYLTFSVQI